MTAPSYKHNKEVFLPNPESPIKETYYELRKREMSRVFNRETKSISKGFDSNLSKAEITGLKSLKRRIKKGEVVVCQTDKSKRFAILSQQQYLASGNIHTSKDMEIQPHLIKKIQSYVNDHTWWAKEILQCGANWNHFDRMSTNLEDKGEQVCKMSLLIKDHKSWSTESVSPPPSRPVVSGNFGLNCHLSELISTILEPIAYEESGNEMDSTDDMIAKISKINEQIELDSKLLGCPKENVKFKPRISNKSFKQEIFESKEPEQSVAFEKSDIRSYLSKPKVKNEDNDQLVDRIEKLRLSRDKDNCLPVLGDRLTAGWVTDKIVGREPIKNLARRLVFSKAINS